MPHRAWSQAETCWLVRFDEVTLLLSKAVFTGARMFACLHLPQLGLGSELLVVAYEDEVLC